MRSIFVAIKLEIHFVGGFLLQGMVTQKGLLFGSWYCRVRMRVTVLSSSYYILQL